MDKMGGEDIVIIYTIVKKKLLIPFYLLKKVKNLQIFFNEVCQIQKSIFYSFYLMFSISLINYVKNLNHTQKIYNLILKKNIKLQHQPINLFFGSSKKEEAKNQMILPSRHDKEGEGMSWIITKTYLALLLFAILFLDFKPNTHKINLQFFNHRILSSFSLLISILLQSTNERENNNFLDNSLK